MNSSEYTGRSFCPSAWFVTEIAQRPRRPVTQAVKDDQRSRCPGGVPSSPWRLTGSGVFGLSSGRDAYVTRMVAALTRRADGAERRYADHNVRVVRRTPRLS